MKRSAIKRKAPKKRQGHDKSMRDACRGQCCYLQVEGVCRSYEGDPTVVPCHANSLELGKGIGLKVPDMLTVPGCYACHNWLDQGKAPRIDKEYVWLQAYEKWSIDRKVK